MRVRSSVEFFSKMLYADEIWKKYTSREKIKGARWAKLPKPPTVETLVPSAYYEEPIWYFTTKNTEENWYKLDFSPAEWKTGAGGFGTQGTPGADVGTQWNTREIWIRRKFDLNAPIPENVGLRMHHDENAIVYINGKLVLEVSGYTTRYEFLKSILPS